MATFDHSPSEYKEAAVPCTNCLRRFYEGDIKHVCELEIGKITTKCLHCRYTGLVCSWIQGDTELGECAKIVPTRQHLIVLKHQASEADPIAKSLQDLATSNFLSLCRHVIEALKGSEPAQPLAQFGPESTLPSTPNSIHPQHPEYPFGIDEEAINKIKALIEEVDAVCDKVDLLEDSVKQLSLANKDMATRT